MFKKDKMNNKITKEKGTNPINRPLMLSRRKHVEIPVRFIAEAKSICSLTKYNELSLIETRGTINGLFYCSYQKNFEDQINLQDA